MSFKKDSRKRRSDRLMFSIPLRAEGLTEAGEAFECGGHAIAVNRFGAHIRLERPVPVAHKIMLTNLENSLRGEFRIVRALESPTAGEMDFGVEALGNYPTFWGIDFPARPRKPGESRGLLECQQCHSATLHPLMLDEIEELESGGTVRKHCASCGSRTEWKFAIEDSRAPLPEPDPAATSEAERARFTVFMQHPVSIWTASGEVETVQTENISKEEIRCASEKNYQANQVVTLEWENSGSGQRMRVQGRIRRRQTVAGSRRVVYSIRHEGAPAILPPTPLHAAGTLYVAMGAWVVATAILLEVKIREIGYAPAVSSGDAAHRVAYLGVVLLMVLLAHKTWKAIVAREPENRRAFKKRHRVALWLVAVFFLGSIAAGAIDGFTRGYQNQRLRMVLQDFAMARLFESNIDAAEDRVTGSPADYADVCATLKLLAGKWQKRLDALSADTLAMDHTQLWQHHKIHKAMSGLEEIIILDRRKLLLVQQQIALEAEADALSPEKRQAFWQSQFPPLRQQIREIDAQESRVAKTLTAEK
jgi:hypothetical protein